jgi:hypothetical protein
LSVYFILIGVLSSLPQGILATHFIDRVFNSILGANLGQSLEGGIDIALDFYRERKDDLRALANSTMLQDLLEEDIPRNPENLGPKAGGDLTRSLFPPGLLPPRRDAPFTRK